MSENLRREFLVIMGKNYDEYGYPSFCGWVEGILLLEPHEWAQREISRRLRELLPESKYPTSVPSVNRALKLLEDYGVIERSGSRKIGYKYRLGSSSGLVVSTLQRFLTVNQNFTRRMEDLMAKDVEGDSDLKRALLFELNGAKLWSKLIESMRKSITGAEDVREGKELHKKAC